MALDHLFLDSLESATATSRRLQNISQPFLMEHRALQTQISDVLFEVNRCHEMRVFLCEMLVDPWKVHYVRNMKIMSVLFKSWSNPWYPKDKIGLNSMTITQHQRTLFDDAIRKAPFIEAKDTNYSRAKSAMGNEDPILAILIQFLPNLRSFRIVSTANFTLVRKVVDLVAETCNQEKNNHKVLQKLGEVTLLDYDA